LAACQAQTQDANQIGAGASISNVENEIEGIRQQIVQLSRQRSTPDEAINSYFAVQTLLHQLGCYRSEAAKSHRETSPTEDATIDAFFSSVALESRTRNRRNLQNCLERRERALIDIRDVHMDTPTHATLVVNIKNVTPIPAGAEGDDSQRRRRRDGQDYRVQLSKSHDGWKIVQVYTTYFEGGSQTPQYSTDDYYPDSVVSIFF
jgi:hypothetical protein